MQDMHITCKWERLQSMIQAFEEQFRAMDEVKVLDYGYSYKEQAGYIVIEWDSDEVDEMFIHQLTADTDVVDFCVFSVPCTADEYPFGRELIQS